MDLKFHAKHEIVSEHVVIEWITQQYPVQILILVLFYLCDILSVPISPVSSQMHPNPKTRSPVRLLITLFMDKASILEEHRVDFSIGGFKSVNIWD